MSHFRPSLTRRGFSLLEVMIALAILTTSIVILVETQSTAAWATREAEKVVTGTDLARYKMSEALLRVEADGFTDGEIFESGDFRDLGDEVLNLQMGEALEDFHWEYAVQEIDIQLAGDIAAMASEFAGDDGFRQELRPLLLVACRLGLEHLQRDFAVN